MYTEEQQEYNLTKQNLLAALRVETLTLDEIFSAAEALYWYCYEWHGGGGSDEYSILSELQYKPGMMENGVEAGTEAYDVYCELVNGGVEPRPLLKIIQEWQEEQENEKR